MEEEMSFEQLEKLANNPSYTLNDKQLARLEHLRSQRFKPFEKQELKVKKHNTYFEKTRNSS